MRLCTHPDCDRVHYARGLCSRHYQRQYRTARDPDYRPRAPTGPCQIEGCAAPVRARGLCQPHYAAAWRAARAGQSSPPPPRLRRTCTEPGCDRAHHAKGLCPMHSQRVRRRRLAADRPYHPGGNWGRLWDDPERREAVRQAQREGALRRWSDPAQREALRQVQRAAAAARRAAKEPD